MSLTRTVTMTKVIPDLCLRKVEMFQCRITIDDDFLRSFAYRLDHLLDWHMILIIRMNIKGNVSRKSFLNESLRFCTSVLTLALLCFPL